MANYSLNVSVAIGSYITCLMCGSTLLSFSRIQLEPRGSLFTFGIFTFYCTYAGVRSFDRNNPPPLALVLAMYIYLAINIIRERLVFKRFHSEFGSKFIGLSNLLCLFSASLASALTLLLFVFLLSLMAVFVAARLATGVLGVMMAGG